MELLKRTITAAILIIIIYFFVIKSSQIVFFLGLQIFVFLSYYELLNIVFEKDELPLKFASLINGAILSLYFILKGELEIFIFSGLLISSIFILKFTKKERLKNFPYNFSLILFLPIYIVFSLNFLFLIYIEDKLLIFFLLVLISFGDTMAYFFGKAFGRKKIFPTASPKKTIAGFLANLLFTPIVVYFSWKIFLSGYSIKFLLISGILISIVSQLSDPVESLFKRWKGVKDSSNLLPGHGGFLDRVDSYILSSPLFYFLLKYMNLITINFR